MVGKGLSQLAGDITRNACPFAHRLRRVPALAPEKDLLAEDGEVRLVRGEREHDEVGVQPVQDVPRVGVVPGLSIVVWGVGW
jgi:hypothetical protein